MGTVFTGLQFKDGIEIENPQPVSQAAAWSTAFRAPLLENLLILSQRPQKLKIYYSLSP